MARLAQPTGDRSRLRPRARRLGTLAVTAVAATIGMQALGVAPALANAANPSPDTAGTAVVNADGTVTANLHGTWTWPGQSCAGRWGEGWAVDWWGVSSSKTPSPSFSLTNASVVATPGTTSTGTVSPAGAIPIKNGGFFHVGQYYAGEDINSSSTCTDTGTGHATGSTGPWSATATYPSLADIPPQVCVNIYDEHGSEGKISKSTNDFSPIKDSDNSIQTNAFDPTSGVGYCVALHVVTQTIQGEIYKCVNGAPSTSLVSGGTVAVPSASLSSSNPLAPTKVAAGDYTVKATAPSGQQFVACGQSGVTINGGSASQGVTVPSGGAGDAKFYVTPNPPTFGYIEVCKSSANGVKGDFTFKIAPTSTATPVTVTVPAGACSPAVKVPSGTEYVHEKSHTGYAFAGATTQPSDRLIKVNASSATAQVFVPAGDVSTQTIVTVTNKPVYGTLKICQIAGSGVAVGTEFGFTTSATSGTTDVPAGPDPGYCEIASTSIQQGRQVTVTQNIPAGDKVTAIKVDPSGRQVGSVDLTHGQVTVTIGSGVTEVTYTDQAGSYS
jgi:hypothetical protein